MRSAEQFDAAKQLFAAGLNDCAIARQVGVPRTTVRDWRRRPAIRSRDLGASCAVAHEFSQLPADAYCYVLGLYLGDGCISRNRRVWHLRITLDTGYPAIIKRCREAIDKLMPGQRAGIVQRGGCVANRSEDILGLFTAALDVLDIPWTRSSKFIVSIDRKAATARLDEFVGPKHRAVPLNGVHYTA